MPDRNVGHPYRLRNAKKIWRPDIPVGPRFPPRYTPLCPATPRCTPLHPTTPPSGARQECRASLPPTKCNNFPNSIQPTTNSRQKYSLFCEIAFVPPTCKCTNRIVVHALCSDVFADMEVLSNHGQVMRRGSFRHDNIRRCTRAVGRTDRN